MRFCKFFSVGMVIILLTLSGCAGKHNIPEEWMQLVAIKYDAAWINGYKHNSHKAAANGFREVLEMAPAFAEAHYNLGIALAHQSKWNEALSEFDYALAISPNFQMALEAQGLARGVVDGTRKST